MKIFRPQFTLWLAETRAKCPAWTRLRGSEGEGGRRGQGMAEFALILPLLLLFLLGVMEAGRMLVIYSSVSTAAKQAARYGSVGGDSNPTSPGEQPFYLDCAGMRERAKKASVLQGLGDSDINIWYVTGPITSTVGACVGDTAVLSNTIQDGYRVIISITTTYRPIVPIVPLPPMSVNYVAARTIFTKIAGATSTPRPNPDLALTKTDRPDPVVPNSPFTYTLGVANNGGSVAEGIVLTDRLPLGLTNITVNPVPPTGPGQSAWSCPGPFLPGRVFTCTLAFLGGLNTATPIYVRVTAPITSGTITNTAGVRFSQPDSVITNNVRSEATTVMTAVDLEVTKTGAAPTIGAGRRFTYTIQVRNYANTGSVAQTVTDTLPAGATYIPIGSGGTGWTCTPNVNIVVCNRTSVPPLMNGSLAPPLTIYITTPLGSQLPANGQITNTVSAADISPAPAGPYPDPYPGNNVNITAVTTVNADADIDIDKVAAASIDVDTDMTYVITVRNHGPAVATGVFMIDNLPLDPNTVTPGVGWTCSPLSRTLRCDYGPNLGPGETAPDILIQVRSPATEQVVNNTANASAQNADPNTSNNSETATTTVVNCGRNRVSTATSVVTSDPAEVPGDGSTFSNVTVTLRDNCNRLVESRQQVTLSSSRGVADSITLKSGYSNPTTTGQIVFEVRSSTPGQSIYTASAANLDLGGTVILTDTATVDFFNCVRLSEGPVSGGANTFFVENNTGVTRRLLSVNLDWPASSGRSATSVALAGKTIWSGSSANDPLVIPGGGLVWLAEPDPNRVVANGATGQNLVFNFNYGVAGTGQYILTTTWDDNAGGRTCTASVTVNR